VQDEVEMRWQSCFGRCTQGPNTLVREIVARDPGSPAPSRFVFAALPSGRRTLTALYNRLTTDDACALVDEHVIGGKIVRRLIERPVRSKTNSKPADTGSAETGD
jgi:(2Fe-2S) ferredoxin